jgi:hypothetical protein
VLSGRARASRIETGPAQRKRKGRCRGGKLEVGWDGDGLVLYWRALQLQVGLAMRTRRYRKIDYSISYRLHIGCGQGRQIGACSRCAVGEVVEVSYHLLRRSACGVFLEDRYLSKCSWKDSQNPMRRSTCRLSLLGTGRGGIGGGLHCAASLVTRSYRRECLSASDKELHQPFCLFTLLPGRALDQAYTSTAIHRNLHLHIQPYRTIRRLPSLPWPHGVASSRNLQQYPRFSSPCP